MLISLELTNFRNHESLTINFTPGLNAIRMPNEGGKSNMLEALSYAWWGARALPFSLEDTVTWGKPVSSLKVKHSFAVSGAEFTVTRSKSGAELIGPGVTVSGHEAVTNFICNLFGADLKTGLSVLFAKQGALQDTLDGPAVSLIEQLSGMDVIDSAIVKMQAALPNGNTRTLEAQIASFQALNAPEAPDNNAELNVATAAEAMQIAQNGLLSAEKACLEASPSVVAANAEIAAIRTRNSQRKVLADQLRVTGELQEPALQEVDIQALRDAQVAQKEHTRRRDLFGKFLGITEPEPKYEVLDVATYNATVAHVTDSRSKLTKQINALKISTATAKAMLITDSACGLCGKDLQNVPEVVEKNAKTQASIDEFAKQITDLEQQHLSFTAQLEELQQMQSDDQKVKAAFGAVPDLVTLDTSVMPAKPVWAVEEPSDERDTRDYAAEIRKAEADVSMYNKLKGEYTAKVSAREVAKVTLDALGAPETEDAQQSVLDTYKVLEQAKLAALLSNNKAAADYASAVKSAEHQAALYKQAQDTYEKSLAQKTELEKLVVETMRNNALIKKLREARPIVAKGLWNNVLQGVSSIFSGIRGRESLIARADNGFTIDGKSYKQYSGSTQDALGMAIRIMLQKTFLGNFDSIIFDEPGSGADEVRETAMIASLSRVEFAQVLLVTHSNLADAHATNVITF